MTKNQQTEQNEIGRRTARHAASYCAERCDIASAIRISGAWGIASWRLFIIGGPLSPLEPLDASVTAHFGGRL